MADWYYIGHYGQLGPLTFEQIEELIQGCVIARDTYVWHGGLRDWMPAEHVGDLRPAFALIQPVAVPPPPPAPRTPATPALPRPMAADLYLPPNPHFNPLAYGVVRSDRSRAIAGLLQVFPGVGRMYLGYWAHGVLQLVFSMCAGIGILWSWIDGLIILGGGIKLDGYGRRLPE